MNFEFYLSIAISAGVGTAIVEIIFKLILSHWLERVFYKFKLNVADKRKCADEILDLISSKKYLNWHDLSDDVYYSAYTISDRLITLGEEESSKILDEFVNLKRYGKQLQDQILANQTGVRNPELEKDFIDNMHKEDDVRNKLVKIAQKMKK